MNSKDKKHNDDEKLREAFELTPSEKKALESLTRERMPNAALEDRVVGALRDCGVLVPRRRRVIELTARRIAAAVAACLVLLAVSFALGQWAGSRQVARDDFIAPETSETTLAATLQQAGSAYVTALQRFAELPDSVNGNQAVQGREVALTTLYTAADQVTRLVPKYELARQLLAAIDAHPDARKTYVSGDAAKGGTMVVEF
ncbi:MAG: hypothetical protein JSV16_15690 [Candidatus Hydrogenedentota bacterium]|nr:MAG: hypothetical protein JSV16_15690 [Candidatus Hydrogenedentota bacterium]